MSNEDEVPMTLSREDLYELAWSKPISELAKDFGISDVALAKRCRRLGIPVPGRGYWARLDAGQTPYRPKLPSREPQGGDQGALTVQSDRASPNRADVSESGIEDDDAAWLKERIDFEEKPENAVQVPETVRTWDPVIRCFRDELEKEAAEMRASRRASKRSSESWKWRSAEDRGQRLRDTHKAIAFRVSLGTYKRAVAIANALTLAGAQRGFTVRDDRDKGRIAFACQGAEVHMGITELLETRVRPHVRYDGETEQRKYKVPTGRLRITLQDVYDGPKFEDRRSRGLEAQLNQVFVVISRLVVREWRREREHRARLRQREEEERRYAELMRRKAERDRAIAEERLRRDQLSTEAQNWIRAKSIREYVEHVRAKVATGLAADEAFRKWVDWSLLVAEELDPTAARIGDMQADPVK